MVLSTWFVFFFDDAFWNSHVWIGFIRVDLPKLKVSLAPFTIKPGMVQWLMTFLCFFSDLFLGYFDRL